LELSLKPADTLTGDDALFMLANFFHAQRRRMVDVYPRYADLLSRRGASVAPADLQAAARRFSVDDLRDLQVWHKLAWIDPFYLDADQRVRRLVGKGRQFSEDDKHLLRAVELELLNRVIPEYRDGVARGQIEVSTSPFYHPILPLLCDTDIYLRTHPSSAMPRHRFQHPEDASEQLARAVGSDRIRLFRLERRCGSRRSREPARRRRRPLSRAHRRGRGPHPHHSGRRKRLGAFRRRWPALPAGLVQPAPEPSGAHDGDDG